jgi:putative acetyltransferase
VIIRPASPADFPAIRAVVAAAFGRDEEADIVEAVRAADEALAELVAEDADRIIGHVLLNRMTCATPLAGLAPLSVAPAHQNQGIGGALTRSGLEACRGLGMKGCVVLGDPAYYRRFGFARAPATLSSPYAHLAAFQALAFETGVFDRPLAAAYPSAFG